MRLSNPQRQPLKERLFDFRHRPVSLTPIPYLFARTVLPVFQQPHESLHFSEPDESYGEGQLTTVESNLKLPLSHWEYVYADTPQFVGQTPEEVKIVHPQTDTKSHRGRLTAAHA